MKTRALLQMTTIFLTAILFLGTGCNSSKAETPVGAQTQNHEEHHPKAPVAEKDSSGAEMVEKGEMMNNSMMEKMDMNQMMKKCQKNMSKKECNKKMNEAKNQDKTIKKIE